MSNILDGRIHLVHNSKTNLFLHICAHIDLKSTGICSTSIVAEEFIHTFYLATMRYRVLASHDFYYYLCLKMCVLLLRRYLCFRYIHI
jgi:hypothetical protein